MKNFSEIWKIYKESFPENERRDLQKHKELLSNSLYNLQSIYDEKKLIGFIAIWDLVDFIFIEHFAIKKELRGKGYGTKTFKQIIKKYNKNIVLEVEKPETYEAKRRITFYEKLGFHLNEYNYNQPAYNQNTQSVSLFIMSYPQKINQSEFIEIRDRLYTTVYKISNGDGSVCGF